MTSVTVEIEVEDRSVTALLTLLDTRLNPAAIGAFLGEVVDPYIRERAEQRFAGEGDDVVGNWAPLGAATQMIRAQQGYGPSHPINKRTGELEQYIIGSPNRVLVTPIGATLQTPGNAPTGELKDKVTTAQRGRSDPPTVARPVMGIGPKDVVAVLTMLAFYIQPSGRGVML